MSDNDDIEVESDEEQPRFQSAADKRAHHNALERKRRDHIKDSFHSLRDSVPSLQGEKITGEARGLNTWFSQPYASAGDKQGKQMAARSEEDVQEPVRRARLLREDRGQLPRRQPQPQLRPASSWCEREGSILQTRSESGRLQSLPGRSAPAGQSGCCALSQLVSDSSVSCRGCLPEPILGRGHLNQQL
ncbi:protein max isoform X12 [Cavia porcellus]|uniref:protein max isoform X12 n=1 Tax=Cavia porcellus TaxID=10141 RepID=UPI000C877323|nr:protein max isoform X3 [Cavia porcellus]